MTEDFESSRGLYGISVAAELTGVNPQALRGYEAKGLVEPYRTEGGTRRYSGHDITRINHISTLLAAGLNLAGVVRVLELESEARQLRAELDQLAARRPGKAAPTRDARGGNE